MSTFESGAKFGKFLIQECVGQADIAELYIAEQTNLQRKVFLRLVSPAIAQARPERLDYFLRCGRAVAQLTHPAIVAIHEVGKLTDQKGNAYHFIVEEFIDGRSLAARLVEQPSLPQKQALEVIGAIGSALSHVHRAGLLHGAMRPQAILFDRHDQVKLTGLGHTVGDDGASTAVLSDGDPSPEP